MGHRPLQPCLVPECGYGQHRYRLCYTHSRAWDKAGRPAVDQWKPELGSRPAVVCAIPGWWCGRNWTRAGADPTTPGGGSMEASTTTEFITDCVSYGEDRFDFRPLPPGLRLEIGYALQCRVDANRTRTTPRSIKPLLDHLAGSGAWSLLERRLADWLTGLPAAAAVNTPRAFLGDAIERLLDLHDGAGSDSEYQRDGGYHAGGHRRP